MASDNDTPEDGAAAAVDIATNGEQEEIPWVDAAIEDLVPPDEKAGGDDEPTEVVVDDEPVGIEAIGETGWEQKVEIKTKDGGVEYKTIGQLVKEGMFESDYRQKTTDINRREGQLKEDRVILDLINKDKASREFFTKRLDDIKEGREEPDAFDIGLSEEEIENIPWLGKIVDKLKSQDVELSRYRATQKQSHANQTVGKIETVMKTAQAAIEKETGLKLKHDEFRARVGSAIVGSMNEDVPEDKRILAAGQMMLTDKDYYLSKARSVYQQERELARDKAITEAKNKKSKDVGQTRVLAGGGAAGASADPGVVKDAKGQVDFVSTLAKFYQGGGKGA